MNQRETSAYERYKRSDCYSLYEAYDSYSDAKERAWQYCKDLCCEKNGRGLKVIGHNSNFFSAGFLYEEDEKEMFMFITHGGDYPIEIEK